MSAFAGVKDARAALLFRRHVTVYCTLPDTTIPVPLTNAVRLVMNCLNTPQGETSGRFKKEHNLVKEEHLGRVVVGILNGYRSVRIVRC